jgi:hypothetical protein
MVSLLMIKTRFDSCSYLLGAHIPVLSCEDQFLDVIYLGLFVILSPAFDRRLYFKPPPSLLDEMTYAIHRFHCLMQVISVRFVFFLEGTAVALSYLVDRMLAEFAAASVVFGKRVDGPLGEGNEIGGVRITFPRFLQKITGIIEEYNPDLVPFFSTRVVAHHKDFFWTGLDLQILPRTPDVLSIVEVTGPGERLDFPGHPIYSNESLAPAALLRKRDRVEDAMDTGDDQAKKRKH